MNRPVLEKDLKLSRRSFIVGSAAIAGGGLALGLSLPFGAAYAEGTPEGATQVNLWVAIKPDDTCVIRVARSENQFRVQCLGDPLCGNCPETGGAACHYNRFHLNQTSLRNYELHRLLVSCGEGDPVLHTGAPDPPNLSCGSDVGDWIAVDQHEVGPSAGFDHASVV